MAVVRALGLFGHIQWVEHCRWSAEAESRLEAGWLELEQEREVALSSFLASSSAHRGACLLMHVLWLCSRSPVRTSGSLRPFALGSGGQSGLVGLSRDCGHESSGERLPCSGHSSDSESDLVTGLSTSVEAAEAGCLLSAACLTGR